VSAADIADLVRVLGTSLPTGSPGLRLGLDEQLVAELVSRAKTVLTDIGLVQIDVATAQRAGIAEHDRDASFEPKIVA